MELRLFGAFDRRHPPLVLVVVGKQTPLKVQQVGSGTGSRWKVGLFAVTSRG